MLQSMQTRVRWPSPLLSLALIVQWIVLWSLAVPPPTFAQTSDEDVPTVQSLGPDVWAVLQPHRLWFNESNSLVAAGDDFALVVDVPGDLDRARRLAATVRELTDRPVRYLVFTHWHGDHVQGASVFRDAFGDDLLLVGHDTLTEDVPGRAEAMLQDDLQRLVDGIELVEDGVAENVCPDGVPHLCEAGTALDDESRERLSGALERAHNRRTQLEEIELLPPDLTFSEHLTLDLGGGRMIQLHHLPGHTRGDVVIQLPAAGVVATGDLLDALPFGGHGDPDAWIESLGRLDGLGWTVAVPGHGGLLEGRESLRLVRRMFGFLRAEAHGARAAEIPLEDARDAVLADPRTARFRERLAGDDALSGRAFDRFFPETFDRFYALAGEK